MRLLIQESRTLILKEVVLEWRHLSAFNGILLYLVSTVFVCYLSFERVITLNTWNSLFWIILLFASLNAVLKSFIQERQGRLLYLYSICSAEAVISSKMIYNAMLMGILSIIGLLIFIAFMGNPVNNMGLFFINMLLGVVGFSSVMSMVSAIASKTRNNFTLMGVLSFPLILPLLLVLMRVSSAAISGSSILEQTGNIFVVVLLTGITFVLSNVLFPYIWRE
jgi:heme exporter protein B